jgi:hypothetical protein
LKDLLDDTYETQAEERGAAGARLSTKGSTVYSGISYWSWSCFQTEYRFNIALEDRFNHYHDDLLDGQQWAEQSMQFTTQYFPYRP